MNLFLLSAIFAIISLDRKHAFQIAVSQPLITSTFIGLLLGAPMQAMYFGMIVQLVWLSNLPIGAAKTPEGDIGSIIGCIIYVKFYEQFSEYGQFLLFSTFLFTVFCSFIANLIESLARKFNIYFYDYAYNSIKNSNKERVGYSIAGALLVQFILNFVFIVLSVFIGAKLLAILHPVVINIPADVWQFVKVAIFGSGIGMLTAVFKDKKSKRIISALSLLFLIILILI